jgi:YbbR domain-containing protein
VKINSLDVLLANRWVLRGISFLIALLLWFFVAWDRDTAGARTFRLVLEYRNVPEGFSLVRDVEGVDVKLAGSLSRLAEVDPATLSAVVDLKGLKSGVFRLPVRLLIPQGVRASSVAPTQVRVELIKMGERRVPVFVDLREPVPEGMKLELLKIDPPEVLLKGPAAEIARVLSAKIRPSLDQVREGKAIRLPVVLEGRSSGKIQVEIEPPEILLVAAVSRDFSEVLLPVHVPIHGEPDGDFVIASIRMEPDRVRLKGPTRSLGGLKGLSLEPLDVTGIREDATLSLPVVLPRPELVVEGPSLVRVEVRLKPRQTSRLYEDVPIRIEGKSVYRNWKIDPPTVSVLVEGSPSATQGGSSGEPVEAYVDVTNLVSRRLVVPVLFRIRGDVKVIRVEPPQTTLRALDP